MKIVITGGLGYIGTELCKLYAGESRFKEIVVVDNKFISERVKQLRDWGINFIHGDIMNETLMSKILKNTDIVYHLAGITDVAYTNTESDSVKDAAIKNIGENGSRIVIDNCPSSCKLIFPSTHVVFEGFDSEVFNVNEDEKVRPVLTYSKGKVQTEKDLLQSKLNYVIVRLGSVIGYSLDTMRINIMPNLFSKIASQEGQIKLFSGGRQHKSIVTVFDVVRCLKHLAELDSTKRQIFHCSSDNTSVKDVAVICKEFSPNVDLIETDDEVPNLGYTMSNQKLLNTGFEFKYPVKNAIQEMINNWSKKEKFSELENIERGGNEFIDERGKISNYELSEPINLIGYIESKSGTLRANHFHPIQEQKCLLIKGKYISVLKDLSIPDAVMETKIMNEGDLSSIHPNVAHSMVFLEDSIFLNLVRGERKHENYGVTHTMPYELVNKNLNTFIVDHYKSECRCCGNPRLKQVVSLGLSPLANSLLDSVNATDELYPLELNFCPSCFNCQLSAVVPPEKMFKDYLYVSSTNKTFREHFSNFANELIDNYDLNSSSLVVDIGSNDGIFLKPLKERGINIIGVDPAQNLADIANSNNIETIPDFFNETVVNQILESKGDADIVSAFNVFAHADDLKGIVKNAFKLLKSKGVFIIEVQYILDTLKDVTFDNIYHEHVNYWSVTSLNNFFKILDLQLFKVEHVNTHGGSIRAYISSKSNSEVDLSVTTFIDSEKAFGICEYRVYKEFSKNIEKLKSETINKILNTKKNGKSIVGYGSPAKATTVLNYYGISNKHIDYIIEDNELKLNRFLPGMKIPIKAKAVSLKNPPDYILVLAWNFLEDIKLNNPELLDAGCKFVTLKDLNW
jgi:nucleoside-diphosphate-sugar epimerase/SAM-dependent methyltransferase